MGAEDKRATANDCLSDWREMLPKSWFYDYCGGQSLKIKNLGNVCKQLRWLYQIPGVSKSCHHWNSTRLDRERCLKDRRQENNALQLDRESLQDPNHTNMMKYQLPEVLQNLTRKDGHLKPHQSRQGIDWAAPLNAIVKNIWKGVLMRQFFK